MDIEIASSHPLHQKIVEMKTKDYLPNELVDIVEYIVLRQEEAVGQARLPKMKELPLSTADEIKRGRPVLLRGDFPVDQAQVKGLFREFTDHFAASPVFGKAILTLKDLTQAGEFVLEQAVDRFVSGDDTYFEVLGEMTPQAPRLISFLVQSSVTPSILSMARTLAEAHLKEDGTHQGLCPICGSLPLIGRLKDKEGAKVLTCSFCRTEYRVARLGCPFCDERDPCKLTFFDAKEEPGFRVEVCQSCRRYMKILDFREFDRSCVPVLDDLISLPFDLRAQKDEYVRPTLSAWGF